jgi:hypothetical protein
VGIAVVPGVREHARSVLAALAPWTGGHRLPNFTFHADEFPSAYDDWTRARLRHSIRRYDPDGVIAIAHTLNS